MWGLYRGDELVPPLLYSNEKGQDQVVREILELFNSYDIIFLQGAVGTGKSAIALSVANKMNGGIVVVPTKTLQQQYVKDYCKGGEYRILKDDRTWLRVELIKGRSNFRCLLNPKVMCNHKTLPCVKPLCKGSTRVEQARICKYYSPIIPMKLESTYFKELGCKFETLRYEAVGGVFSILRRNEKICPYYQQYSNYIFSDVILMNSAIWMIETLTLKRKPIKSVEIIDEGDSFLDGLSLRKVISSRTLKRIQKKLGDDASEEEKEGFEAIKKRFVSITQKKYEGEIREEEKSFLKQFVKFLKNIEEEDNYSDIFEFLDECFVSIKSQRNPQIEYFIPEPVLVLKRLRDLTAKKILFMSATFQSQEILENVFGLDNFCFVEGETKFPGTVRLMQVGTESRVTYKNWEYKNFREAYWRMLVKAIKKSAKPCLVPVHAYKYLPDTIRERLARGRTGTLKTKSGDVVFSTVMKRGIDLKGDKCRSIVLLKYPFPDMNDPVLRAMKLKLGEKTFWQYYHDIAERELIQTIGRGVRSNDDWVEVWSPDKTVLGYVKNLWKGDIIEPNQQKLFI